MELNTAVGEKHVLLRHSLTSTVQVIRALYLETTIDCRYYYVSHTAGASFQESPM